MTNDEVIQQLHELIRDRQSFLDGDLEHDLIYLEDVQALMVAVEALQKQPRWIPCSERLPERGKKMNADVAVKWLIHLCNAMGDKRYSDLWHYEQPIAEIIGLLQYQKRRLQSYESRLRKREETPND